MTDAIAAMGLGSGLHQLGTMAVEVTGNAARLPGKETLAGRYGVCVWWWGGDTLHQLGTMAVEVTGNAPGKETLAGRYGVCVWW